MKEQSQKSIEQKAAELDSTAVELLEFINKTKNFVMNYEGVGVDSVDALSEERVLLEKYDCATDDVLEVGRMLSIAYVYKASIKKLKAESMARDIIARRMLSPIFSQIESLSSELDDLIQALLGLKSAVESKARFFEKSQYLIFAQKTFV